MLSEAELADIRAAQAAGLPDMATLYRTARTVDATGGISGTRAQMGTERCRVSRANPREVQQGGKTVALADWIVTLPYGTDVRTDDEIETGGRTLRVVGLLSGGFRTCERALCA